MRLDLTVLDKKTMPRFSHPSMTRPFPMTNLTTDAIEIWNASVDAVRARPLVQRVVRCDRNAFQVEEHRWSRSDFDSLLVIGAGKAATEMTAGLLEAVGDAMPIRGWINVPGGTERSLPGIKVTVARPAGVNEPTEQGVAATRYILQQVKQAGPRDLCIVLLSGGGSALLTAPAAGISLHDKLATIRWLSSHGADITELNTVRKHLSDVKGGGLRKACRAGALATLVLSDVLGDPLDVIASGPTTLDTSTVEDALKVLERFDPDRELPSSIYKRLEQADSVDASGQGLDATTIVIGNNAVAVDSAGIRAEALGYNHTMHAATQCEGAAEDVGRRLADSLLSMLQRGPDEHRSDCLITGGEPTVTLVDASQRGLGGRNQQLVLAAYIALCKAGLSPEQWSRLCLLSGGTDGEDGPTDAAGGWIDADVHRRAEAQKLDAADFLRRNDAYRFLEATGGLLKTGPTGTNVCDVRVALVGERAR